MRTHKEETKTASSCLILRAFFCLEKQKKAGKKQEYKGGLKRNIHPFGRKTLESKPPFRLDRVVDKSTYIIIYLYPKKVV